MSDTRGMIPLAVVLTEGVMPSKEVIDRLETVFLGHFGFLSDFEVEETKCEIDGEMQFDGTVYFHVDYMLVHAHEARARQREMAAYIEAFLHGTGIEFEVIGD